MAKSPPTKPHRKGATVPDLHLWNEIKSTVKPLKQRDGAARRAIAADAPETASGAAGTPPPPATPKKRTALHTKAPAPAPPAPARQNTMTGLDRRTSQRLVRGNVEIDARHDLHGLTKENARLSLLNFIVRCRQNGYRTVLVITGKGKTSISRHTLHSYDHFDMPEREGILRRALPAWLSEPEFYEHVTGFQPAHPKHGGGGAFYVRLRRPGK